MLGLQACASISSLLLPSQRPETEALKGKVVQGNGGRGGRTQTQTAWETSALPLSCLYLSLMSLVLSGLKRAREPQRNDAVLSRTLTTLTTLGGFLGIPKKLWKS